MIAVEDVSISIEGKPILNGMRFVAPRGKITAVAGVSGSGKSLLMRAIAGLHPLDTGEIRLDSTIYREMTDAERNTFRREVGIVFPGGALLSWMTVAENIALPIRTHSDLDEETIRIMVRLKLDTVGLPATIESARPSELSPGIVKRVAFARALALDPRYLIVDEPTAHLDPVNGAAILRLLKTLTESLDVTTIVSSNDLRSVIDVAGQIVVLYENQIIAAGEPADVRLSPNPVVKQLLDGNPDGPLTDVSEANLAVLAGWDDE
jgi:phospholipid/cholesterol/gamma-HCH transport system ATP-binding protein